MASDKGKIKIMGKGRAGHRLRQEHTRNMDIKDS